MTRTFERTLRVRDGWQSNLESVIDERTRVISVFDAEHIDDSDEAFIRSNVWRERGDML